MTVASTTAATVAATFKLLLLALLVAGCVVLVVSFAGVMSVGVDRVALSAGSCTSGIGIMPRAADHRKQVIGELAWLIKAVVNAHQPLGMRSDQ